jgi:hypothetical protein
MSILGLRRPHPGAASSSNERFWDAASVVEHLNRKLLGNQSDVKRRYRKFAFKLEGKRVFGDSHFPPAPARFGALSHQVNAFKKCSQLSRRPELRDGFQFLEGKPDLSPSRIRREL